MKKKPPIQVITPTGMKWLSEAAPTPETAYAISAYHQAAIRAEEANAAAQEAQRVLERTAYLYAEAMKEVPK